MAERPTLVAKAIPLLLVGLGLAGCGRRLPERPISVTLIPLGKVSEREVLAVRRAIEKTFRARVSIGQREPLPKSAFYPPRQRYRAARLTAWLEDQGSGDKVLGLAKADISVTTRGHAD